MKQYLNDTERLRLLALRPEKLDMILDTDTFNEVDDQFALAYALCSKERLNVEAVYAAPFLNQTVSSPAEGMKKSHAEILRLLAKMHLSGKVNVFEGSESFLPSGDVAVESPAARDLVKRAKAHSPENPLYAVCIAAATDIASAILLEPSIIKNMVIIWLGGNPMHWCTAREFNLSQDIAAARILFDCGAALVHIPAMGVSSHLLTTLPELKAHLEGKNALCDALIELYAAYSPDHYGWSKEIWDISAIAYLINPDWVPATIVHSPLLTDSHSFSTDRNRHFIKCADFVYRNPIFSDMFRKLSALKD